MYTVLRVAHMLCNKLWAGALLKTDFELWLCPSFPSGLLSALCAVSLLQLALCLSSYCTVVCEFIAWKMRTQQTWSLSLLPLKHWFPLLLPQRGLISDKSRLSLVQAWILWGFIYWSFLPWMVFSIVLHYFVALDTLPLVMLTSVPCFHGWLGLTKSFEMFVLFFHWCCLFKDLSPMSMVVASGQKPQCALMDYSSWIRWGMSQLLINQPIQTPGFIPSLTHAKTFIRLHEIGTTLKQGQGYCLAVLLLEWAGGLCFLFF